MNQDEYHQQELEIQERIETDPEYRREYEKWLDEQRKKDERQDEAVG